MIWYRIWRTKRKRDNYKIKTEQQIKKLRKGGQHQEASDLVEQMNQELYLWHEAIEVFKTEELRRQADRVGVPMPKDSLDTKVWSASLEDSSLYLSTDAQLQLRKQIRQERNERLDVWINVITKIGGFVLGILSLLLAYAALKLKH